jgi:hypothetical protein
MKLRGSTVVAAALAAAGKAEARWQMGAKAIQIYTPGGMYWSRKLVILRNAPYTIESPHLGQIKLRKLFGKLAREAKAQGLKGIKEGLPAVAWYIHTNLPKHPDKAAIEAVKMKPEDYPSRKYRTVHTLEQLEVLEKQKEAERRKRAAAGLPP